MKNGKTVIPYNNRAVERIEDNIDRFIGLSPETIYQAIATEQIGAMFRDDGQQIASTLRVLNDMEGKSDLIVTLFDMLKKRDLNKLENQRVGLFLGLSNLKEIYDLPILKAGDEKIYLNDLSDYTLTCFAQRVIKHCIECNKPRMIQHFLSNYSFERVDIEIEYFGHVKVLHWAAYNGFTDLVKVLINSGVNIKSTDPHGKKAYDYAFDQKHWETGRAFLFPKEEEIPGLEATPIHLLPPKKRYCIGHGGEKSLF